MTGRMMLSEYVRRTLAQVGLEDDGDAGHLGHILDELSILFAKLEQLQVLLFVGQLVLGRVGGARRNLGVGTSAVRRLLGVTVAGG